MMEKAEQAEMRKENFLKLAACGTFHPHMHELTHTPVSGWRQGWMLRGGWWRHLDLWHASKATGAQTKTH